MKLLNKIILAATVAVSFASIAVAQDKPQGVNSTAGSRQSGAITSMTSGEIKKVDKDAGKVTIKHEELKNLEMPAMTMVFRVKDPAMLDTVKAGDKVSFVAEKIEGQYTVTQIKEAK